MTAHAKLTDVIRRALSDLSACGKPALVGGMAIGAYSLPRTTRDVDFAMSVASDREAEAVVHAMGVRAYSVALVLENTEVGRLSTVRLTSPLDDATMVDLLFSSSGIEPEIVAAASTIDIVPGLPCPVAQRGHLIALKLLARSERRPQDDMDIAALLERVGDRDLDLAREAVRLIVERGHARQKDLVADLAAAIAHATVT